MILLASPLAVHADGGAASFVRKDTVITEKFFIYYKVDSIDINPTYLQNKRNIAHIKNYLQNSPRIDSITIYAWASPEGGYRHNEWLSQERAKTAKRFLLSNSPDSLKLNSGKIKISPIAENWEGLEKIVVERYQRHDREKVLKILRDKSVGDETRKWRLQRLDNGYTWTYLKRRYMPELRAATWICVWAQVIPELPEAPNIKDSLVAQTKPLPKPPISVIEEKNTICALKTNLLYDAATAVNIEVEVPIGERWSIAVEDMFPWWTWGPNRNKYAFQILQISMEPRWWFSKGSDEQRLTGHFAGVYAMSSMYDLQRNRDLCYQGEAWSVGLSYGYSLPIGDFLNLEFSASVGYLQTDYRHYQPDPGYDNLYIDKYRTGTLKYFGPTKLEVSLVLPIDIYVKRGGER